MKHYAGTKADSASKQSVMDDKVLLALHRAETPQDAMAWYQANQPSNAVVLRALLKLAWVLIRKL